MGVHCQVAESKVVISIEGSFDVSCYDDFNDAYKPYLADAGSVFVIDMFKTDYLDSSALGMLLLLRERTGGDKRRIQIIHVNQAVMDILKVAHFDQLFAVQPQA